jgi:hypothetical protein
MNITSSGTRFRSPAPNIPKTLTYSKSARYELGFAATRILTAHQTNPTHQSVHYCAPPSHQSCGTLLKNTRPFALSLYRRNSSHPNLSAYLRKARETKGDAVESSTELCAHEYVLPAPTTTPLYRHLPILLIWTLMDNP